MSLKQDRERTQKVLKSSPSQAYGMDKLSSQDKTWAEFSSLDSAVFVKAKNHTHFVKQPNLKL